jgi:predicted RNA binding protein YcfA (HicA-like mRNA interferase family)
MSSHLPPISGKDLIRILLQQGFFISRQSGSHVILRHADGRGTTVPLHAHRDLGKGLLRQILRDSGLTPDDLKR